MCFFFNIRFLGKGYSVRVVGFLSESVVALSI